jgi:hypothetical protein
MMNITHSVLGAQIIVSSRTSIFHVGLTFSGASAPPRRNTTETPSTTRADLVGSRAAVVRTRLARPPGVCARSHTHTRTGMPAAGAHASCAAALPSGSSRLPCPPPPRPPSFPTDYLIQMLVLANEMLDSPPVFAWVLPVFVRLKPGKEETFFSVSRSRIFCFFHLVHFRSVVKR